MKIIDEKGRLFKTINALDLLIISLFVFVLFSVYFGVVYPRNVSRIVTGKVHYAPVAIKMVLDKDMEWIYDSILLKDIQKGRFDKPIAEITGKSWEVLGDMRYVVINLSIQAQVEVNGVLTYGGKVLKSGERFVFESDKIKLNGLVKDIKQI